MKHMVAAAETIADYVARGRNVFENDSALRDAIVYQIIIGEAAKAVVMADDKIPADVPEIEWSPWARMRDKVTHQYWATDREIVWSTAKSDRHADRAAREPSLPQAHLRSRAPLR